MTEPDIPGWEWDEYDRYVEATSVKIESPKTPVKNGIINLKSGETTVLQALVSPDETSNPEVEWECSDPEKGILYEEKNIPGITFRALKEGDVTVTVKVKSTPRVKASVRIVISRFL